MKETVLAIDPVCGMKVDPQNPKGGSFVFRDQEYFFCAPRCRERFAAHPESFLNKASSANEGLKDAFFTCPMHPEVRQLGPGSCPLCGMALEPEDASLASLTSPELIDLLKRLRIAVPLTLPVFFSGMSHWVPRLHLYAAGQWRGWLELALTLPIVFWCGWPLLVKAFLSVKNRNLNMFTLIAVGVLASFFSSVIALIFPTWLPSQLFAHGSPLYFETAAVITTLVLLGQYLELEARQNTGQALRSLLELAPPRALRIQAHGVDEEIDLAQVQVGDQLRLRPGDRIPVDGVVLQGESSVNEAMVTGESVPQTKRPGAIVIGGTLNGQGSFVMRAERVGSQTLLAQIVHLVREAQRSQAPVQRLADQIARWFVPAVLALAAITAGAWLMWGPEPQWTYALANALAVIVIACPCALGLATPMSIVVGTGRGAQVGVLFRNATALERLAQINTLLIDKTGTLTAGSPELKNIKSLDPRLSELALLQRVASLERHSEHPFGQAVLNAARAKSLELLEVENFKSIPGQGIVGVVAGRKMIIGSAAYLKSEGLSPGPLEALSTQLIRDGHMVALIGTEGRVQGLLSVSDPIKPGAADALTAIKQRGLKIVMVTGDHVGTAKLVGEKLGLADVRAEVLPAQKLEIVKELQAQGGKVAMAGDGVNDAPALARADVGLAMGNGTDIAIESAGVALVKGDLYGIVRALDLARAVTKNIRQNLAFAFLYNAVGLIVATGALYPWTGWLLSPIVASLAMSLSSVSVIVNSLRLTKVKFERSAIE